MTGDEALEKARRVVLSVYEATDQADADGAQMLDAQWYFPIWGCDTADQLIERFAAALLAAAGGDESESSSRTDGPDEDAVRWESWLRRLAPPGLLTDDEWGRLMRIARRLDSEASGS